MHLGVAPVWRLSELTGGTILAPNRREPMGGTVLAVGEELTGGPDSGPSGLGGGPNFRAERPGATTPLPPPGLGGGTKLASGGGTSLAALRTDGWHCFGSGFGSRRGTDRWPRFRPERIGGWPQLPCIELPGRICRRRTGGWHQTNQRVAPVGSRVGGWLQSDRRLAPSWQRCPAWQRSELMGGTILAGGPIQADGWSHSGMLLLSGGLRGGTNWPLLLLSGGLRGGTNWPWGFGGGTDWPGRTCVSMTNF